jgi:hypothetical protein
LQVQGPHLLLEVFQAIEDHRNGQAPGASGSVVANAPMFSSAWG